MAQKDLPDNEGNYGALMTLGFNLAAGLIVLVLLGQFLDHKLGDGIICTVIGMVLAFVYGGYEVWKILKNLNEK